MKEKFILTYDDENEILNLKIRGVLDVEDMREMTRIYMKLTEGKPRRYILADVTEIAQLDTSIMTKEMRNAYKDLPKVMSPDRAAIFGASPAMRMVAKIALVLTVKSDITKFFKTREDALAWLKGDAKP